MELVIKCGNEEEQEKLRAYLLGQGLTDTSTLYNKNWKESSITKVYSGGTSFQSLITGSNPSLFGNPWPLEHPDTMPKLLALINQSPQEREV